MCPSYLSMNLLNQILTLFEFFFHICISCTNFLLLSPKQDHKPRSLQGREITQNSKVVAGSQVPRQRPQNSNLEIWSIHMIGLLLLHFKNLENSDKNPEFYLILEKKGLLEHWGHSF